MDRRALLASLALLPALSVPFFPASAPAQTATSGGSLPSWNDGPAKQAIVDFVRATSDRSSPSYVVPEDRIAMFDQDGTLWVEHPMYTQVIYCLDRVPAVVAKKPELKNSRAFQDRAVGQPGGDRQAPDAGPREDPRRDDEWHDRGGVQRRSKEMARNGQGIRAGTGPTPSLPISRCSKCCATSATTATRPTS